MGGLAATDDLEVRNGGKLFHGVGLHLRHVPQLVLQMIAAQFHRLGEACNLGGGLRAGAEAHFLAAAGQQGPGIPDPGADVQGADALGGADLMAGEGDEVCPQSFGGEGDFQKALDRVGVEQGFFIDGLQTLGDVCNGIDAAQLVVHHHHGHQRRVRPHRRQNGFGGNVAVLIRQDGRDLPALLLQLLAAVEDGVVLHGGGDDVAAHMAVLPAGGPDGPVVTLGAAGGKEKLVCFAAYGFGNHSPPILHAAAHFLSEGILCVGVGVLFCQHGVHGVRHSLGDRRGGGVVQIDHKKSSSCPIPKINV